MDDQFNLLTEHLAHPRNRGRLPEANGRAIVKDEVNGCALRISLLIEGGYVLESRWHAYGESVLGAIASFVTECMQGREVEAVINGIRVEDVARTLRIPPRKMRYVQMVVVAMLDAIQNHRQRCGHLYSTGGSAHDR